MTALNVVQTAAAVLLLVAAAAGVIGYFKANISKSTIELYREDNAALRTRVETLEHQTLSDQAEIRNLKTTVATLTKIVTQADAIAALRAKQDATYDLVQEILHKVA